MGKIVRKGREDSRGQTRQPRCGRMRKIIKKENEKQSKQRKETDLAGGQGRPEEEKGACWGAGGLLMYLYRDAPSPFQETGFFSAYKTRTLPAITLPTEFFFFYSEWTTCACRWPQTVVCKLLFGDGEADASSSHPAFPSRTLEQQCHTPSSVHPMSRRCTQRQVTIGVPISSTKQNRVDHIVISL
jgi:hypothetical protein